MTRITIAALTALLIFTSACTNLGPRAVEAGREDYNQVLRDTTDEQLLTNLVRLRYRDRPYYLEVSAVNTQFSFNPQLSATAALGPSEIQPDVLLGAGVAYEELPTISYTPLQGEDFVRRLLTPVTLDSLILLSHSGWSVERLLRICVKRINGIPNAVTASGPTPHEAPAYETFLELARALRRLQLRDDMTIGFSAVGDAEKPALFFTRRALESDDYQMLVDVLGLQAGRQQYRIAAALRGGGEDFIGIQTRSLNGMLYYLAHAVNVPETHRAQGWVNETRRRDGSAFDWGHMTQGLMQIHATVAKPATAAVRIRYRDHWFYIDDADLDSKSTFSLLAQLFALQAGGDEGLRPVLTLPIGR